MIKTFLTVFIFLSLTARAQTDNQKKVTIELTNISVDEALTILAISYAVEFSYSDDVVPTQKIVNLLVKNESLTAALDKLFTGLNVGYKIVNNRVLLRRSPAILVQTIRGSIKEEITQIPIPAVSVIVQNEDGQIVSFTDSTGRFKIDNVPVGRVNIQVSCIGYKTRTVNNVLLGTGKELVLDLPLAEAVLAMNEVTITAQKNEDIPGDGVGLTSSKSFSVEETKRYAGSMGDPARLVTAFAGVTGASDESNALIVRGNSPRGMLWRIEGIEVPNPNHFTTEGSSGGVVSVLSTNMIEDSDFLTGAFPAQYGNALSGVFDINLRNGNNERKEYSIQAGLLGMEASAEGPINKSTASYLVNYRYSTLSILDKLEFDLNDAGQYKDYQDLSFKINCPTSRSGTFALFGIGGKSHADKTGADSFDKRISDLGILGLTYRNKISETSYLQGALSISGTRIGKDSEIAGLSSGLLAVEESYTKSYMRAALSGKKRISTHFVLEGGLIHSLLNYDFYMRNRDAGNAAYQEIVNFRENGNSSITQGFLYARQYFSPSLFGFYGAHYMHFALTDDYSWEPRFGLRWQPSEVTSWSVAFGKHSRIENLQYYLARDHQQGGNEVQINKALGFTRANHIVLSYERSIFTEHRIKLETYYQKLYNAPVQLDPSSLYSAINEDTGFITDTLVNNGNGKNYGIELSIEKAFTYNFYYLLNGSLYESKFRVDSLPEKNTTYNGNYNIHFLVGKEFNVKGGRDLLGVNFKIIKQAEEDLYPLIWIDQKKKAGRCIFGNALLKINCQIILEPIFNLYTGRIIRDIP